MKKSGYGKLSILCILVATLFCCAAIAIFGLSTNDRTGATGSSAEISAPELDASTAIGGGETSDDGTISQPELEATATADFSGIASWSSAVTSSGASTIHITGSQTMSASVYTVPSGKDITIQIDSGATLQMFQNTELIVASGGILRITGAGTLQRIPVNGGGSSNFTTSHSIIVNNGTLNLSGVTLKWASANMTAELYYGGAVYNNGTFNMSSGTISDCKSTRGGGGVFNVSGKTFNMTGGTISGCSTGGWGGGGVRNEGTFTMTGGTISGNSAEGGGGGVCTEGSFTMSGSTATISGNTVNNNGGGVYVGSTGTFNMLGYTISGNSATYGAGVYVSGGTFTQSGGFMSSNSATYGGGVYVASGTFNLTGGTTGYSYTNSGNSASIGGGGVYVYGGEFNLSGGSVSNNRATDFAGGVYVGGSGSISMTSGSISSNSVTGTGNGGGLYYDRSGIIAYVNGGTISGNNATHGGGVYINNGNVQTGSGSTSGSGCNIINNSATNGGGAYVYGSGATLTMPGGHIYGNTATNNGGGVYMTGACTVTLVFGGIGSEGNVNTAVNGGGIYNGGGTVNIGNSFKITYNTASGNGGGIYLSSGTVSMTTASNDISYNTASGNGGGVYLGGGTFDFTGGTVAANTAVRGGGVYYNGGTFTFNGGTIGGSSANANTATSYGGGVYLNASWTPTKGTISYNTAGNSTSTGGGGVCVGLGTFTLNNTNVTISNNSAHVGGGVFVYGGTFNMSSGNLRSNSASSYGGAVCVTNSASFTQSGGTIGGSSSYENSASQGGGVFVNSTGTINLSGGTISYNSAPGGGGGVYLYNGTITQRNTVSNNYATTNGTATGAGVYLRAGTYNLPAGSISNNQVANSSSNSSSYGGGVYIAGGTFNLNGGTVSSNTATGAPGTHAGGGIYLNGGALNISSGYVTGNSAVNPNSATGLGGGVYTNGGTFTLSGGYLRSNTAATYGGGVYTNGGTFRMTGGTIGGGGYANTALNGAGVYLNSSTAAAISAGTISYNTATGSGGGVYVNASRSLTVSNTANISYNSANNGGGLYISGSVTLSGGSIYHNTATVSGGGVCMSGANAVLEITGGTIGGTGTSYANNAANGGGVYIASGAFNMSAGTVSYNTATYGAGLYNNGGNVTLSGTAAILYNNASSSGGGLSNYSGTLNINGENVAIHHNISNVTTAGYGGGMYINGGTVTLTEGKIYSNNSTYGGGAFVNGGTFAMNGGIIGGEGTGNTVIRNGGGVMVNPSGTFTMSDGTISYNSAKNSDPSGSQWGWGGGVGGSGHFTMTGGVISHNTAATYGGGVGIYTNGEVSLQGGEISENSATRGGGGIATNQATINISGATVSGNTAPNGGGAYVMAGTISMSAGEISENTATSYGGGLYISDGVAAVTGGEITRNVADTPYGAGAYIAGGSLKLGATPYIYGNTYRELENNVYTKTESTITFSGALTSGAKIGILTDSTDDLVLTSGFTTAGHTQADIARYFSSDIHGLTLQYLNNEIVIRYDMVLAWNETVQASLDNNSTETFILFYDWTPESGAFGSGVGFYGTGLIYVPEHASVLFDFNGKNVDRDGTSGSSMRVEGTLVLDTYTTGSITGGNAENGGAIYIYGGSLTLKNGSICDNVASYGGAIYVDGSGEFILEGGTIVRNEAENGGAVYVKDGTATLTDGTIGGTTTDKNTATSFGGAIFVDGGGFVTVDGAGVSYNEALSGGAIYVNGGRFTFVSGNIVSNSADNGGGLYVDGGSAEMTGGNLTYSTATYGGGAYIANGSLTVSDGYIRYNEAENGAGVYVAGGNVLMSGGSVYSNEASQNGGGVYVTGTSSQFTITGGNIGVRAGNDAVNGAGIYVNGGTVTVSDDAVIRMNEATLGGGIYLANGNLNMTGGEIYQSTADNGAGVYVAGGDFRLSGGNIHDNEGLNGLGVYVAGGAFTMSGGEITLNIANSNGLGGGVYVADGTFSMTDGAIHGNEATQGAGVYFADGTFNLSGGEIRENAATGNGGGVYSEGQLNITGGKISGNTANTGGGVYIYSGNVLMNGGEISGNEATWGGGGIQAEDGNLFTLNNGVISGNNAATGGGVYVSENIAFTMNGGEISGNDAVYGGGVYANGSFTMLGGEISGNTANSGGGVYVAITSGNPNDLFAMSGGEISGNSAHSGAGVYINNGDTFNFSGGSITGNTATGATTTYGGGIYLNTDAVLNISDTAEITSNTAVHGGGIYSNAGTVNLTAGTISENEASSGGGIYIHGGSAELTGGEITENHATDANVGAGGGGVFVSSGTLNVSGTAKINANNTARYGGGIRIDGTTDSATVEITAGSVSGNTATIGGGVYVAGNFASLILSNSATLAENEATTSGGGIAVFSGATAEINDNAYLTTNVASQNGGGAYVSDTGSTLTVSDKGAIINNEANYGGAVYIASSAIVNVDSGSLTANSAVHSGGAVYVTGATFNFNGGEISGNTATENGGAVFVAASANSTFKMNGGVIGGQDNAANTAALGGGVYMAGGVVTMTNGSITGNTATSNGGGVYFNAGTLSVSGTPVISGNKLQDSDSNLYLYNGKTITVIGKLNDGALIGVTGTGRVTDGFDANGNGDAEKDFFFGDVIGTIVVIQAGEVYLQISLEDAWNAAVQASLDKNGTPVTFVLAETWRADANGEFGDGSGVGFTDNGALYLPDGAYIILNLNGYTINRNFGSVTAEGSVFYVKGSLEISGTTGYISGGYSDNGGGVYVEDGGYFKMTVGYIQNNSAENGAGLYLASGAEAELLGGTIRGNSATTNGGGVYVEDGATLVLSGGTIGGTGFANTADNGAGVYSEGTFTITDGYVRNNTATYGGGVYVADGEFIAEGGYIGGTASSFANTAEYGAGIYVAGGKLTLDGTSIAYNTATEDGGGVYVTTGGTFTMSDGNVNSNTATFGGGVYVDSGTFEMTGGVIDSNYAEAGGGAFARDAKVTIKGGAISSNESEGYGGGVILHGGEFIMTGGSITSNTANDNGGGIYATTSAELTIDGGAITENLTMSTTNDYCGGGVYLTRGSLFTMNGGEISDNGADLGGGVYVHNGTFEMNGGTISCNGALEGGGVYVYTDGTFEMNGGEITGHVVNNGAAAVNVYNGGLFTMNDGKITGNTTVGSSSGGAIYLHPTSVFTMNGGLIANNTEMNQAGGAISVNGATFNMNGGEISGNTATQGGAIYLNNYAGLTDSALTAKFNMNGGKISGNTATGNGGAVFADPYTTFTMTDGEITNNIAANGGGVYNKGTFILSGGTITENRATSLGGGIYVTSEATLDLSGSPMVYGNSANGDENNIYLVDAKTIAVTGMLAVNGMIAYLGVTMADPSKKKFTLGFASHNSDYNPDLRPETVFFSDNTDYMVSLEDGEAVLVTNDYSQTSLVWQVSKDGGASWITVDAPYYSLRYKAGETYAVRALDGEGNVIPFTWATDANGDINANSFSGIGSYKFVINSEDYLNPSLTFEVLPAQLFWQYSTDEGRTWLDITSNSLVYTSATYQVRACVYDNGYVVIQSFADTMKDVGDYEYTVDDVDLYENPTLNFKITTRYITVDWNFGDALGNATNGYYWNYDGLLHTPIAVLNGVSSELAGIDLSYGYLWNGTTGYSSAQAFAGTYTLTVGLQNADPNIVLSNTTVTFKINAVTLSLEWVDEDGNSGDEFTFEYDNEPHGVDFILNGVITGDVVGAYITYATRSGKILSEAPTAVGYYTATVKLPADCYNYVFDKTYTCQIVITQKEVAVQWQPNTDGTFVWTFNGLGKGPVVSIINPYTGEELNEPYKIEYAPVASNGNIGQYTTTQPVNAGNYIVRVTLNNPDANYVLDADTATQKFTIEKLGVTITWSGATYDPDKDVYFWEYDGDEHDLEAEISLLGLDVYQNGAIISTLGFERTDARTKLVTVGSATATVVLLNNTFNANFYFENSASQVYEVRKAVINAVEWTDKLNQKFDSDDTPEYDFGSISGVNGPAFTALGNGTVSLEVTYNKTYTGDWVVDETVGYIAYAKLSSADAANYEFADGAEYFSITFFIKSVGGFKTPIDVTWVVFINDNDYVLLDQYLNDGGFVYNDKVQYPTPIYIKDNGVDYEVLELQPNSIGKNAGKYTARIKPSSVYNISEEDFTCDYEIKKLDIVISWQDGQYDSNTTFNYVYNGNEQAPYAYVLGTYDFDIDITVKGKTNAGTYPATAVVNGNFNITSGKTQVYTISKLGLDAGLVVWDFSNAGASGDATNGWYWIYDGNDHAPTAKITISSLGIELELVVTGKTSEIGTHSAYAVLNSSLTAHNNFYLIGTAETSFEIVQVKAGQVYWEDASGHTYEDGKGGDTGLVFTFNGDVNGQAPKAYYVDEDGNKVYLTVTVIGGTAVDAGTYTAYVSSDLDFDSAMPSCTFKIEAMEITVEWDGDTELTFNGEEQAPSVTLSTGADGYTLVEGVDYEIVGFTNAGKHTAEIKFLNNNYTCADTVKTFDFEIKKIELTDNEFAWDTTDGYDADTDSYFWEYDGDEHHPEVTINYAIDGVDVVFEIEYIGAASTVGNHKVTAVIKSATLNGVDITDNFVFEVEMEYVIKSVSVTIDWDWSGAQTGVDENGETYYFWSYDGDEHAPKAYLADADGNRIQDENGNDIELDVYGAETNARKAAYTATAVVPSEYNFTGDNTHKFFIMEATIEVNWDFTGATAKVDAEGNTYYEWTYGDSVTPKAYIKNADGTNGAELTVTGIETDAGTHTLTVMQNDGNYTFADASDASMTYVIVPKTVYVIWYGAGGIDNDDTTDFEWTYGGENTVPTAYLAYKDANGDLQLLLDEDNKPIKVEVSGASNEIGTHSAQVVDTFVNYDFASDAEITKNFTINEKEATNFEWNAEGAEVTGNATDGFTFTYEYSGDNNLPVPSSSVDGLEFNTTIVKVNDDGSETTVLSITEVGTYKVTVSSRDGNYKIPDGLEEITVVVTARTVEVEWDESELIYNGENQMPKAYYTDVDGNKVELEVTVVGNSANAGATYTATASQPSNTNYVLGTDITKDFEITAKTIQVEWSDNEFEYDGTAHASLPKIVLTSAEKDDITRIVYEITDKDGNVVAGTDENDKKVKNAGEYTVKVWLEGPAAANYQLDIDEYVFNINRKEITITAADDKEVNFGDKLTLTIDDVVISGLLADEAADITEELKESLKQWLICWYVQYSEPGEYTIFVDVDWLNDNLLANYKVVGVNGLLTVNPVDGELVWVADKYVEDEDGNSYPVFTYDGTNKLPKVYYFVGNEKHYLNDYVKLATYDEATGTYTVITDPDFEAKAVDTYYAVIVDNEGNIITEMGGYEFANSGVKFEIVKREIVINLNVDGFAEWKYGDVSDETVAELLGIDIGYLIGSTKPLAGDDLGIKLEIVESFENGFLNAGSYTIKIRWNSEDFGENYTITVVAGEEKITDVENDAEIFTSELAKAEIEVNLDKSGNYYFNDYIILTNGQHECDFLDNPEDFIGIAGYQGADVTIRFSEAFVKGEEPSLEGFEFTNDRPASITEAGEYVFLFKIVVDNHEEFTGTLLVKAVDKENVLYVTVKGNVEKSYGEFEVTDGLAKWLFTENYAGYDSDISPEAVTEEIFLKWVTATVFDEDNNVVTGKLGVGTYKVVFGLSSEAPEKYGIHVNDSKHVYIEITKFVLEIDWGDADNLNYTFDGETHMPVITLKGVTDEYGNPVTLTVGENLITVNGETVKLIVTVDGDFTAAGGHSVHVAVEDENFTIDEENALCSVSITEPATEVPAPGVSAGVGLEDWQLWLIIAAAIILLLIILILVIVLVKRRQAGDDDGFYDPVDESNL